MRYRQLFLANFSEIITLYLWGMISFFSSFPSSHFSFTFCLQLMGNGGDDWR
ncbi:unnamed protein product [Brassica oleracea]